MSVLLRGCCSRHLQMVYSFFSPMALLKSQINTGPLQLYDMCSKVSVSFSCAEACLVQQRDAALDGNEKLLQQQNDDLVRQKHPWDAEKWGFNCDPVFVFFGLCLVWKDSTVEGAIIRNIEPKRGLFLWWMTFFMSVDILYSSSFAKALRFAWYAAHRKYWFASERQL